MHPMYQNSGADKIIEKMVILQELWCLLFGKNRNHSDNFLQRVPYDNIL